MSSSSSDSYSCCTTTTTRMLPCCLLNNHDITNLFLTEQSVYEYVARCEELRPEDSTIREFHEMIARQRHQHQQQPDELQYALYPNMSDACNRRLIQELPALEWNEVPLVKLSAYKTSDEDNNNNNNNKLSEFYALQQREQQQQSERMTSFPERRFSAPLHHHQQQQQHFDASSVDGSCAQSLPPSFPSMYDQHHDDAASCSSAPVQPRGPPRRCVSSASAQPPPPAVRQQRPQRHSVSGTGTTSCDINSSSGGLRPRINYKALYGRRSSSTPSLERSLSGYSQHSLGSIGEQQPQPSDCSATLDSSGRRSSATSANNNVIDEEASAYSEQPIEDDNSHFSTSTGGTPRTMEIAPNVHVEVRSSQETYKAVNSGDYTVATCFACCATIVCVNDAAYVLCPDCQVVSPLGVGTGATIAADGTKKDDPYGIGTGLKREWVNGHLH